MEKLIYLLSERERVGGADVARALLEEAAPRLVAGGVRALTVEVAIGDANLKHIAPMRNERLDVSAAAALWLDSVDRRGPIEKTLAATGARVAGYLVTESIPREYDARPWRDGTRSPGVTLLSLIEKPARLADQEFLALWHDAHTPLALEVHPLWRYARNVVTRVLTPGAPPLKGIVAERLRALEDITDPMRFYGGGGSEERMQANIQRVLEHASRFLDLDRVQSFAMYEHIIKS